MEILLPYFSVWTWVLISIFAKITSSQTAWLTDRCECEVNTPPWATYSLSPINYWSACKDWAEQDRENTGCYSGVQERKLRCIYRSIDGLNGAEITQLNAITPLCLERKRCLSQGRACEGYWGHWANNGRCNCIRKERTQSRYCYRKSESWGTEEKVVVSIHCIGSKGDIEQNRTIKCSSRECPDLPIVPSNIPETRSKIIETSTGQAGNIAATTNITTGQMKTTVDNAEVTPSPLSMQTLIVAGVAVAIAVFAALMLIITCCMKKKQDKKVDKNNYQQPALAPPPPPPAIGTYMRPGVISNTIYRPYVDTNGDAYDMPHPGYRTQPTPGRRAVSTRLAQNPMTTIGQRDRSATVGTLWHEYDTAIRDNVRSNRLRHATNQLRHSAILAMPIREGPYSVPIDHTANDDEIYWSIDDAGPLRQVQTGSYPNISSYQPN